VGVYTKSKSSELSPLRRKLLRFAKQFPPPLRSNEKFKVFFGETLSDYGLRTFPRGQGSCRTRFEPNMWFKTTNINVRGTGSAPFARHKTKLE
jgi:hypothetical protein